MSNQITIKERYTISQCRRGRMKVDANGCHNGCHTWQRWTPLFGQVCGFLRWKPEVEVLLISRDSRGSFCTWALSAWGVTVGVTQSQIAKGPSKPSGEGSQDILTCSQKHRRDWTSL